MTAARKRWILPPADPAAASYLVQQLNLAPVVAQLLVQRGVRSPEAARRFLESPLNGLWPPTRLPGVEAAAEALWQAVQARERICIYGDYDVDGTTGTAILLRLLQLLQADVEFYVPNRMTEGYGVHADALQQLALRGVRWVVTVDCGISALEELETAHRLGLQIIVTDHHEMKPQLPVARVLVHPRLPESDYPGDSQICGAGVAFKLAWRLAQRASGSERVEERLRDFLLDALCLAALGTVADVMPLLDENRIFVKHGLARLMQKPPLGLQALATAAGLPADRSIRAEDIAFKLGPRLNAAGRLECARLVVELLTTSNKIRAREIAEYLEDLNTQRQTVERKATAQAKEQILKAGWHDHEALVVSSPEWHPGVVGIVASRLVDHFGKPAIVIAEQPHEAPSPGSGRSLPGLPLHSALAACQSQLVSFGGHAAAAGLKVRAADIPALREQFRDYVRLHYRGSPPAPLLPVEAEIPLMALNFTLLQDLDRLEPYGTGNPRPRFLATDLVVEGSPRRIGQGERHLSFRVKQHQALFRAVAFGHGERYEELMSQGGRCSLVFVPKINEYQGQRSIELEVQDFQPRSQPWLNDPDAPE